MKLTHFYLLFGLAMISGTVLGQPLNVTFRNDPETKGCRPEIAYTYFSKNHGYDEATAILPFKLPDYEYTSFSILSTKQFSIPVCTVNHVDHNVIVDYSCSRRFDPRISSTIKTFLNKKYILTCAQ